MRLRGELNEASLALASTNKRDQYDREAQRSAILLADRLASQQSALMDANYSLTKQLSDALESNNGLGGGSLNRQLECVRPLIRRLRGIDAEVDVPLLVDVLSSAVMDATLQASKVAEVQDAQRREADARENADAARAEILMRDQRIEELNDDIRTAVASGSQTAQLLGEATREKTRLSDAETKRLATALATSEAMIERKRRDRSALNRLRLENDRNILHERQNVAEAKSRLREVEQASAGAVQLVDALLLRETWKAACATAAYQVTAGGLGPKPVTDETLPSLIAKDVFDASFYCAQVEDNKDLGEVAALNHYLTSGNAANLQPHPLIDPTWMHPQLPIGEEMDLLRFCSDPMWFSTSPHPLFDSKWYLARYPDILAAGVNPLVHYLMDGWRENRRPNALFDGFWYFAANPDIPRNWCPLLHYVLHGAQERRRPHLWFDPNYYLGHYPRYQRGRAGSIFAFPAQRICRRPVS